MLSVSAAAESGAVSGFDLTLERAIELHYAGSDDAALQIYRSLREDRPNDPRLLYEIARASLSSGDFAACMDFAQLGLASNPRDPATYRVMADCQRSEGDSEAALATLSAALQRFPLDATLHLDRALALHDLGRDASPDFTSALALAPTRPEVFLAYAATLDAQGQSNGALLLNLRYIMSAPQAPAATLAAETILKLLGAYATEGTAVDRLQAFVIDIVGTGDPVLEASPLWHSGVEPLLAMADHDVLDTFLHFVGALARTEGSPEWLSAHRTRFEKLVEYLAQPAS